MRITRVHKIILLGLPVLLSLISCETPTTDSVSPPQVQTQTPPALVSKSPLVVPPENPDLDILGLPVVLKMEAEQTKILSIAFSAFQADEEIPTEMRRIENYKVEVMQSKTRHYVLFRPNLAKGEKPSLGGGTSLGMDTMYSIDRASLTVIGRGFFK